MAPTCNPWDIERVPGGSSGGSARCCCSRLCAFSHRYRYRWFHSATRFSVWVSPASNQRMGEFSRLGIIAFASSLDQAGPLVRTVEDAAMMLGVISGVDVGDSTSADMEVPDFSLALMDDIKGLRIGLPKAYFSDSLDAQVSEKIHAALKELEAEGATLVDIDLPHVHQSIAAYYVIAPAEASANLSRYDGVRFGYRCDAPTNLLDLYERSRSGGFGDESSAPDFSGDLCAVCGMLR